MMFKWFILIFIFFILFGIIFYFYETKVTGYASGYVNISVLNWVAISLNNDTIDWGEGVIDYGELNSTLYTNNNHSGIVLRGNWSGAGVTAFEVENIGNVNCSLSIRNNKNASQFFGSLSNSNQEYKINVTNKEPNSCSGNLVGQWVDSNISLGGTRFCDSFYYLSTNNEVFINVLFTVPYDASNLGNQTDVITITASAV